MSDIKEMREKWLLQAEIEKLAREVDALTAKLTRIKALAAKLIPFDEQIARDIYVSDLLEEILGEGEIA